MDWMKLAGFVCILFLFLEAVSAQVNKLKLWIKRVIVFALMAAASLGLGIAAPFVHVDKVQWFINAVSYFAAEYFVFLFIRNELHISAKDFFLKVFGGQVPPAGGGNVGK